MPAKGYKPLNISLPSELIDAARGFFANQRKGAMSRKIERMLIAYLREKKVRIPKSLELKEEA